MSLPTARKDISPNPAGGSVVDPVDSAKKDADVDRKIRLYGVIQAFRQGRMPSNTQIDETLQYVLANSPVNVDALSPEGRKLIQDTRDIIETARVIVAEKNADELFQNFVWHTRDVEYDSVKRDPNDVLPVDREQARSESQQAVRHMRTILNLVLTNSEVRKLLSDFSLIGRDLLAKGAAKAATGIAPDPDRLAHTDEPAPRDQFITEGGRVAENNETPVLSAKVPGTDKTVTQHPHDDIGTGAQIKHEDGTVQSGGSAYDEGRSRAEDVAQAGLERKEEVKGQAANEASATADRAANEGLSDEEVQEKKLGFRERLRGFRDNVNDRIPQQHKDRASDHWNRGKEFLTEEYFPEERRDQFIYRGKKVIIECQKHQDYQESLQWLLSYLEQYAGHARTVAGHGHSATSDLTSDPGMNQAMRELRTLLERFANGQSLDLIIDALNVLIDDANKDEGLRAWFKSLDAYSRRVLLEPGFVLEPRCNSEGREIRENGRQFYDVKYKGHFDRLFDSIGTWFGAMGQDPLNMRFGDDWARLTKDLLFDSEGGLKFKPELWSDIRRVILPTLVDQVGYIPIPRIEYTDDSVDLVVENLTLSGRNLFPNIVSVEAHNFIKFSPYNAIADEGRHEFTLTFSQIQADMRDVAFYFRKKTGIPKMTDSGLADVLIGGSGLTATAHLTGAGKDRSSVFKVKNVVVKVDNLAFSIRDSKHDTLYKMLKPLAGGLVKRQIKKALEDAIKTGLEYVDGQLVGVRDRMEQAKTSDEMTRTQALKDLFKRKQDEVSSKMSTSSSQFKVVSNKRNSVVQSGHPSGWVNRTSEKDELAARGEGWRSDAFSIVGPNAKNTSVDTGANATSPTSANDPANISGTNKTNVDAANTTNA